MDVCQWDAVGLECSEDVTPSETQVFYSNSQVLFLTQGSLLSIHQLIPSRQLLLTIPSGGQIRIIKYCHLNNCLFVLRAAKKLDILFIQDSGISDNQEINADASISEAIIGVEPTFEGEFLLIKSSGMLPPIQRRHFHIFHIQEDIFIGVLDEWTLDIPQLMLYKLSKKDLLYQSSLTLSKSGTFIYMAYFSLLLSINTSESIIEIFHVKYPSQPIFSSTWNPPVNEDDWNFIFPHFFYSPSSHSIFSLSIHLPSLVKQSEPRSALCEILTQVPNSKELLMEYLIEMIKKYAPLQEIFQAFQIISSKPAKKSRSKRRGSYDSFASGSSRDGSSFTEGSPSALSESSRGPQIQYVGSINGVYQPQPTNGDSFTLSQEEMLALIFIPLQDSSAPSSIALSQYVFEYILCLASNQQSPNVFLSEFFAQLYIETGKIAELIMILQHGVLQESLPLAKMLLKASSSNDLLFQLGLDILKRLHEDEEVILELQSRKYLMESLRYAIQFNCMHFISPSKILEESHRSGNKTLFLNVYKWLEEHGLIPIDASLHRSTNGEMLRYISIFREIWGEVVDMEPLNVLE